MSVGNLFTIATRRYLCSTKSILSMDTKMPPERIESNGVMYVEDSGERHPFSVVWTTLPLLSWVAPFIGHMGIADSSGVVHDFSGPYQVTIGSFMCGPAKRVWKLDIEQITLHDSLDSTTKDGTSTGQALDRTFMYDRAVAEGAKIFGKRMHNLFCDNCHSHVATILNLLRYEGRSDWNQFRVCWNIWMKGSWTSTRNAFIVFSPLLFLVTVSAACAIAFS